VRKPVIFGKNKKKRIVILAPVEGELISVTQVNDPTFSEEMLGRGVAIRPSGNRAVAPVTGIVTQMFDTGHAVTLTSDEGVEVLIHVGLDTIRLEGANFTKHASNGDRVKPGDVLIEFDSLAIAKAGYDNVTPVVICNSDKYSNIKAQIGSEVKEGEEMIVLW
jgi:PTS system beta-glucosides-specific IIC component